jgi:hypothetical protein
MQTIQVAACGAFPEKIIQFVNACLGFFKSPEDSVFK